MGRFGLKFLPTDILRRVLTMRSSLGLPLLLLFASVTPMNIKDLLDSYRCGDNFTTCPTDTSGTTTCCPGINKTCCPVGDSYQCCAIENAVCCPNWDGPGGPSCCYNFMQCAPNGSGDKPCMMLTKPANVTKFYDGVSFSPSFPASDVGP